MERIETFLGRGETADGYPFAVCALYRGRCGAVIRGDFEFGKYRDGVAVDARLSQLAEYCCPGAAADGATISIPEAESRCGGIAGVPGTPGASADGAVEKTDGGLTGFAVPARLSVIGEYTEEEISMLREFVSCVLGEEDVTRERAERILGKMKTLGRCALMVSDGSAGEAGIAACVSGGSVRMICLEVE
ncbi:MAG: hypothetical protein ACOYJH_02800 [Anaerovoracaceae bacterium]|jgi:hypothetical protein